MKTIALQTLTNGLQTIGKNKIELNKIIYQKEGLCVKIGAFLMLGETG